MGEQNIRRRLQRYRRYHTETEIVVFVLRRDTVTDNAIMELNFRAAAERSVSALNNTIVYI